MNLINVVTTYHHLKLAATKKGGTMLALLMLTSASIEKKNKHTLQLQASIYKYLKKQALQ